MSTSGSPLTEDEIELFNETLAAAQAGDLTKAFFLAGAGLHHGLSHPLFYKLRGLEHEQSGRPAEAEADFRTALEAAPGDFTVHDMLGLTLSEQGRLEEALGALDEALRLRGDYAPALVNRGWVLENLGDIAGARRDYRRAIEADKGSVRAHAGLALLAARAGQWADARQAAEATLAIARGDPGGRLALAMAALGEGDPAAAIAEAQGLLADPSLHPQEQGVAHTVIGDALDRQDKPAEAFAAYEQANATLRTLYAPRFEGAGGLAVVERLGRAFAAAKGADWSARPGASPAAGHAFVLGFPRSGTTLVGQVLDAHPQVTTLDELETLAQPGVEFMSDEDGLARLAAATPAELDGYRQAYWRRVADFGAEVEGKTFVDKLPMNTIGLPLIAKLFPAAKVLFVRRDPRDVVLSCFRRQFVVNGASWEFLTLEGTARFYDAVMRLARDYLATLPLDVHVLPYEQLVADVPTETGRLAAFLGLPQDAAMSAFAGAARAADIATPSAAQVAGGIFGEGVGQWRRYEAQLAPVMPILEPWIED
ncbi:tetratricopeptide repeat-containing sulfotransferase family protein [Phenylobacterium soli]|nr:sulfotransferase [Phenylobacterium soli]